jgi:ribosomal protein S27AE
MAYIKLLDVPLKCPKCGITRVALGMGLNSSLRTNLDGELPTISYNDRCPDCGEGMQVDGHLKNV